MMASTKAPTTPTPTPITNLRAALAYHALGFCPVLLHERIEQPDGSYTCSCKDSGCTHQGKHPRLANWPTASARASEDDVRKWWSKHPHANVGLLCGDWSSVPASPPTRERKWIVVLDVDSKFDVDTGKTGVETLSDWEDDHEKLPPTPSQKTPSGGYHYVFAHPGVPITTRSNVMPRVDVRADKNGQIVVSPSPDYLWDQRIGETPLAPIPDALLDVLCDPPPASTATSPPDVDGWPDIDTRVDRARRYIAKMPPAISGQGGHDKTWQVTIHVVRGFAVPPDRALPIMREYNARCIPPWSERALQHKVNDAAANAKMVWGAKLERAPTPTTHGDWRDLLLLDKHSRPKKNLANVITILLNADGWKGALVHDDFAMRVMLMHPTPAHAGQHDTYPRQWRDADDILTAEWLQREWLLDVTSSLATEAVLAVAQRNHIHPVRAYLEGIVWDGVVRLNTWLHDYLGVDQSEYSAAVGAKWLVQAVARILRPGCQADAMLILEGVQGAKKSTVLEAMTGREWFTDQIADLAQGKEPSQDLAGKWVVEIAELDAMRRADNSRIKSFLTRRTDHFRASYGRHAEDRPRQCVFAGTTNHGAYLSDETGARRFWPVEVGAINVEAVRRDRDQLWAEAVARFDSGEVWYLDRAELIDAASAQQDARYQSDALEDPIAAWLKSPRTEMLIATGGRITMAALLGDALGLDKVKWGMSEQIRVGRAMTRLGWRKVRYRDNDGSPSWSYVPMRNR